MNVIERETAVGAEAVFASWLQTFGSAMEKADVQALLQCFDAQSYWRDYLAFTWEHRTFSGPQEIGQAMTLTLGRFKPSRIRLSQGRAAPRMVRRASKTVLEGFFDFDTTVGHGTAFVRLLHDPTDPMNPHIWMFLTTLQELHGSEEPVRTRRPSGDEYAKNTVANNWLDDRTAERAFADRDPEVLVIGAGHAGLILAAHLGLMGVDTLVVEKTPRIGDVWRERYHSLTLHNESTANHMPFMPFPETWPVWLSKDRMGGWLETYAESLDINVWARTELLSAQFDAANSRWDTRLRLNDGTERAIRCKHLVTALGVSGSIPHIPDIPGIKDFGGEVKHSAHYTRGKAYAGKRVIVIGTGNSAHDVAQDLYVNGAAYVAMYQRSPTCVVSLEPSATMVYKIYRELPSVDDIDLLTAAIPYPVLEDTYKFMSRRHAELDGPMIAALNKAGFETYYGRDNTGFHMMYLRGEGGYYINVGCSELISNGDVKVIQARNTERFVEEGLLMKDGTLIGCDLVVLATGFKNMQEGIRRLVGDEVADRVGSIWGFDEDKQMRNMWRRTAQDNFWVMGGALIDARLHSRFLALEIKASLNGTLPGRSALPLVPRIGGQSC